MIVVGLLSLALSGKVWTACSMWLCEGCACALIIAQQGRDSGREWDEVNHLLIAGTVKNRPICSWA